MNSIDLENSNVENTCDVEREKTVNTQEAVETVVESVPQSEPKRSVNDTLTQIADKTKDKFEELTHNELATKVLQKAKNTSKKVWIAIAAVLTILIVGTFAISYLTNNYETPLKLVEDFLNDRTHKDPIKDMTKLLNGLCVDEVNAIIKVLEKSEQYEDFEDRGKEQFELIVENFEEQFGDDYKFSYKIEEKEKLDKDDCDDYEDKIKDVAKLFNQALKEFDDYDSDDWKEMADQLGTSRADAKKLVEKMRDLQKELKNVKVSAGYELVLNFMISGNQLDETNEQELSICVYKINGRWFLDIITLIDDFGGFGDLGGFLD